jgi:hypothetical protein
MVRFKAIFAILYSAIILSAYGQTTSWTISSPGSKVQATIQLADLGGTADYPAGQRLYFSVSVGGPSAYSVVVEPSPMGVVRSDKNFVDGLTFVSESVQRTIDSSYTMITGKRRICRNYCNEKTLTFQSVAPAESLQIVLRAYDDGFAFRYRFPKTNSTQLSITSEATGYKVPASSVMWLLPYNTTADPYAPAYEDIWERNVPVGSGPGVTAKPTDSTWCMPALYKTAAGGWALLWETDVLPTFCNSRLSAASQRVYRIKYPPASEWSLLGAAAPSAPVGTLPWTLPWRVVITGTSPGTILESTLSTDLATPSMLSDVSWIKPGRSSWSWWSDNNSPTIYDSITPFINLAQQMTWEYSCVDAGWNTMTGGTWQSLCAYATAKKVGLTMWYNAGGPFNTLTGTGASPRDKLYDSLTRNTELNTISTAGATGVKIDFWLSDKQAAVKYYFDVFRDAAKYHILVDPHGCTVPRGWQRMYPNLITAEANRGAENYIWYPDDPARFPWQQTMMPFTRNAVASMDWTPVTFTNIANPHVTTYGHELALSVIFESGLQHFADRVSGYQTTTISAGAQTFLKQVPVAWDDTKYVQGYPGSWVVLARQKGNDWYAAGIAGDTARNMTVKLSFLAGPPATYQMTLIADGTTATSFSQSMDTVGSGDSVKINTPLRGGWVAKFLNLVAPVAVRGGADHAPSVNFVAPGKFRIAGETFVVPNAYSGKNVTLSLFSPGGSLLKSAVIDKKVISLRKDFGLSSGVYFVSLKTAKQN